MRTLNELRVIQLEAKQKERKERLSEVAPEMLEMLKEINDNDDVYYKIKSVGARARLRKVITKAEGGE